MPTCCAGWGCSNASKTRRWSEGLKIGQRRTIASPYMNDTRRRFLQTLAASSIAPALLDNARASVTADPGGNLLPFHFGQIDVFASKRLQGNPLSAFTDALGLSDSEMQDLACEANLQETTLEQVLNDPP